MFADAQRIVRKGMNHARRLVERWQQLALDGHRMKGGDIRWDDETVEDLYGWSATLFRLDKAQRAFGKIEREMVRLKTFQPIMAKKTIQRGLRAALALAREQRDMIIRGFEDPKEDLTLADMCPECRRYVRPVDRTIEQIEAALNTVALMPPAPGVSRELRELMAATERARVAAYAAVDLLDEKYVEADQLCPHPEFLGRCGVEMARELGARDPELSEEERAQALAYADSLEAVNASLGIPALDAASVTTGQAYNAAEAAVFAYTCRSLADCLAKLRFGQKVDYFGDQAGEAIKGIISDLDRLGVPGC